MLKQLNDHLLPLAAFLKPRLLGKESRFLDPCERRDRTPMPNTAIL
jgi:hypothetical protein